MGLALFLRLVHLGHLSFWSDEILSITRSQAGWSFQLHMLTYESILRLWMGLGESEAVVRMLSVLFSAWRRSRRCMRLGRGSLAFGPG